MIELASRAWKLSLSRTLRKARELGVDVPLASTLDGTVESYTRNVWEPRQRIRDFWRQAQVCYAEAGSANLRYLQRMLGSMDNMGRSWMSHGGQFVGASEKYTAAVAMRGESRAKGNRRGTELFRGKGWDALICIPFWDMPGRICAMLFVGRHADREKGDFIFRVCPEFNQRSDFRRNRVIQRHEAGLAMLSAAWSPPRPDLQGHVFIFDDPWLAVRLQLKWMRTHTVPLPIVASYEDDAYATKRVWEWLPVDKAVCWSPNPGIRQIDQARRARAKISQRVVAAADLDRNLLREKPLTWLRSFARKPVPWDVALRNTMRAASHHEVEEMMLDLGLTGPSMRDFLASCDTELRERLERIYEQRTHLNKVTVGRNRTVYETEDGLFVDSNCISTAVIRVEQVLQAKSGRSYYRGFIRFKGKSIPFTERTDVIEAGIWQWCRQYLRALSVGIPTFNMAWARHALEITFMFHQPEFVEGVDAVGWDNERRQFNFPRFAVKSTGEVVKDYACLFTDESVPGRELSPPESLGKKAVETLSARNDETAIFWATTACVLNNVLAPALRYQPMGVCLSGPGGVVGAEVAVGLGCPERSPDGREYQHQWPCVINWGSRYGYSMRRVLKEQPRWLSSDGARQTVVTTDDVAGRVLGIKQAWNIIHCPRRLGSLQLANGLPGRILPAYLQDLCGRRLWILDRHDTEVENILSDMAGWFEQQGGSPGAVESGRKLLRLPGQFPVWRHFIELLLLINTEGRLGMISAKHHRSTDRVSMLTLEEPNSIWIPQQAFSAAVEASAGLQPDILPITDALQETGALLREEPRHNDRGWVIDDEWFTPTWKKCEAQLGGSE